MPQKTRKELIIDVLRSGQVIMPSQIGFIMSQVTGKEIETAAVTENLSGMTTKGKAGIGYFIQQQATENGYSYQLVPEALEMTPEETYALTKRSGDDQFTLEDAVQKYPGLKKYLPRWRPIKEKTQEYVQVNEDEEARGFTGNKELIGRVIDILKENEIKIQMNITIRIEEEQ